MEGNFFPSLHIGEFKDAHAALSSVGITGHIADFCVAGMDDDPGQPVAYEAQIDKSGSGLNTVLVLAPTERCTVDLCYGYLDLVAETEETAMMRAVKGIENNLAAGETDVPATLMVFKCVPVRRVLQ